MLFEAKLHLQSFSSFTWDANRFAKYGRNWSICAGDLLPVTNSRITWDNKGSHLVARAAILATHMFIIEIISDDKSWVAAICVLLVAWVVSFVRTFKLGIMFFCNCSCATISLGKSSVTNHHSSCSLTNHVSPWTNIINNFGKYHLLQHLCRFAALSWGSDPRLPHTALEPCPAIQSFMHSSWLKSQSYDKLIKSLLLPSLRQVCFGLRTA